MDWISKYEAADRYNAEAQQRARQTLSDKVLEFQPVVEQLRPLIQAQIVEVRQRLGIHLDASIGLEIRVSAPRPPGSILLSAWPFSFTLSDYLEGTVRVLVLYNGRVDRSDDGEPPDGMPLAEWHGTTEHIVDVRAPVDELADTDLKLLIEWLVASYRSDTVKPLALKASAREAARKAAQAKEERRHELRCALANLLTLALGLSGFFLPTGPLVLVLAVAIKSYFVRINRLDGRILSNINIGLGVFDTIVFTIWVMTRHHR